MDISLKEITKNNRAFFLAYDQGLEHGPIEFCDENADPSFIIEIAKRGGYTGVILQKGIVEKYKEEIKKSKVPLILKLNGKTRLFDGEPISEQLCSVEKAISLGAVAVGYTIYIGSSFESKMLKEFEKIQEKSHRHKIPVIAWIYPRGKSVKKYSDSELMAYAARVGLEIGADIVKIKYNGDFKALKWAVKVAGKTKIVISGGEKTEEKIFLNLLKEAIDAGCIGVAVGRNIWQSEKPFDISKKARKIILEDRNS